MLKLKGQLCMQDALRALQGCGHIKFKGPLCMRDALRVLEGVGHAREISAHAASHASTGGCACLCVGGWHCARGRQAAHHRCRHPQGAGVGVRGECNRELMHGVEWIWWSAIEDGLQRNGKQWSGLHKMQLRGVGGIGGVRSRAHAWHGAIRQEHGWLGVWVYV